LQNGDADNATLRLLLQSHMKNREEHERIWRALMAVREHSVEVNPRVKEVVAAIRDVIDRIPPKLR
jgi:hypothetical protein